MTRIKKERLHMTLESGGYYALLKFYASIVGISVVGMHIELMIGPD